MRKRKPLKLHKSPLVLMLAQVRFSPVLLIKDYIPAIQEELRKRKYSDYRAEQIQQVMFTGSDVKAEQVNRWVFASRDRREAVILAPDFVVYETSAYDVFETFLDKFVPVLGLLREKVSLDFASHVGLRYVDLIRPAQGKAASQHLCDTLRGLSKDILKAASVRQQFVVQAQTACGDLTIRSFDASGESMLPPDLASAHVDLALPPDTSELCRILDIDHIGRAQTDFDTSVLVNRLWDLHGPSEDAFLAATTPEAIEFWKSKDDA
ncbi:MAG: TIGR04255 family protein [Planctomycetes bacterium]|nr:TIGR04255 family protein [Planctomycetota bacterium]